MNSIDAAPMDATTPIEITREIVAVSELLYTAAPLYVPVVSDPQGVHGACFRSVLNKIKVDGGSIRFGWIIWERPKLTLSTEFHACWIAPSGNLVDITAKPDGETEIVFAPDPSYPPDFDYWRRPNSRYMRIYQPADWAKLAQDRISELTKSQIKYERNRAIKKGMGFEQWVESRLPVDPLPDLIEEFNRICDEEETLVVPNCSVNGSMITDPYRYEALADKASRIAEQIERHLADSGVPAEPG